MTTNFLERNDEINFIKSLTYNITTKSYKIHTEKLEIWEKATSTHPPESKNFAFIESLFKNPPPTKIVSMYQTNWIFETPVNEPNRNYFKSTWW